MRSVAELNKFGFSLLLAATLSVAGNAFAQDANHPLSLKDAITTAIASNPSVKVTQATVDQAVSQIPLTRSVLYPNVSLLGSVAEKTDPLNGSPKFGGSSYNTYATDLKLTQPLFLYGSFSAVSSAEKDQNLRKLDLEITKRNLISSVIQAYFAVVLDMRNLETLKRSFDIETEALKTAQSRERTGRGQKLDVLQVKTQVALLTAQIATATNQLQIAGATLANLLGDQNAREFHVKDRLDAPDIQHIDQIVDLKSFRLPELEQNRISIEQIQDQKDVALGQNLPTLNLQGDYDFSSYKKAELFQDDASSWAVTVNLNIPLFSGFSSTYQQQVLNAQKSRLEYTRETIVNSTELNQVSSRKALETAFASIESGRDALRFAVDSSNEARRMFKSSTIDFLQLLTTEQAHVQAESSFNTYKFNYIVALSNYFVNSGQELGKLVDALDGVNQ